MSHEPSLGHRVVSVFAAGFILADQQNFLPILENTFSAVQKF